MVLLLFAVTCKETTVCINKPHKKHSKNLDWVVPVRTKRASYRALQYHALSVGTAFTIFGFCYFFVLHCTGI